MPNLRGREFPKYHGWKEERSGRDRDVESNDDLDFGSTGEAEGDFVEESESGREGSS